MFGSDHISGGFASVIICAHNHLEDLSIPCIEHVLQGTSYPYELILVDDGSGDNTIRYFQTYTPKAFRFAKRQGAAKCRNLGLQNAAGDPLVFIDNDAFVPPGWLSIMAEDIQKPGVGILGAIPTTELDRLKARPSPDTLLDFPHVSTACAAVTRRCFNSVGFFDETLMTHGEDTDYCSRARERGFRVASTPRLVVRHLGGITRRHLDKSEFERSARRFREKHIKHQNVLPMPPLYPFG